MSMTRVSYVRELASRCIREVPSRQFRQQQRSIATQTLQESFRRKRRRDLSTSVGRAFATSHPLRDSTSAVPWPKHAHPSPYEVFNLPRSASQQEIKSRYYLLVKQYHPDHAIRTDHHPRTSTERFRKVVEAYKILSHPSKRQEYDTQNPSHEPTQRHSEYRQPWSGSRLSRQKTEQKGPPPSGGWSFHHPSRSRPNINPDYSRMNPSDADNAHFNYERHYRRNLEQEMKIKRRMDELHAHRVEFERQRERDSQTARYGLAFTGGLFFCIVLFARAMYPS